MTDNKQILETFAGVLADNEELREDRDAMYERLESLMSFANDSVGWETLSSWGANDEPVSLQTLKETAEILSDMTSTNPLFKRGKDLRHSYCYSRGVSFENIKPKAQEAMDNPYNRESLFDRQATEQGIRTRGTDGNRFVLKNNSTGELYNIPLVQVADAYLDPNDRSRILYIKRSWTANNKSQTAWYPTANLRDSKKPVSSTIKNAEGRTEKVLTGYTLFHKAYNRPLGQTWGIPDFLPAMMWAKAYSAYLKDNATLVRAYSRIAMKVTSPTKKSKDNSSARLLANTDIGGTAVTDGATDISMLPAQGSNVNFGNGRPLAAMVATSFGVSIVALLSDPGTGGSYGVAETLDPPTLLMAQNLQADEKELYERILRSYANPSAEVTFPSIDKDPAYRALQSISQAVSQGLLHREEGREAAIRLLDIEEPKRGLPKPDGFNNWADPTPTAPSPAASDGKVDPVPSRGNSGSAGSIDQGTNNDARANGEPGTSTK